MRRRALAAGIALTALAGALATDVAGGDPVYVPQTLADARPATTEVVEPAFAVDFVGAVWADPGGAHAGAPSDEGDAHDDDPEVRFRHGGAWSEWQDLGEDGAQSEEQFGTALVDGGGADAYQVRHVPPGGRIVAINTTDGPAEEVGRVPRGAAGASAACRSRADWGADESLMTWTPSFRPVQVLTLHHTDTSNTDADPAATLRAIYRFHAVDRGWGDIGYQFLVDRHGTLYEGRSNGTRSRSCLTEGGTGVDFGHATDGTGRGVVGAHVGGWNSGNLGVAALGRYTSVAPPAAQRSAIEDVLARLASRHRIDPQQTDYTFTNPANGETHDVATISGHRDWGPTDCPGGVLYAALPQIRAAVAARMAATTTTTTSTTSTTTTSTTTTTTTPPTTTTPTTDPGEDDD